MKNFVKFIDKYGMWLFAIWMLFVFILLVNNIKSQTSNEVMK